MKFLCIIILSFSLPTSYGFCGEDPLRKPTVDMLYNTITLILEGRKSILKWAKDMASSLAKRRPHDMAESCLAKAFLISILEQKCRYDESQLDHFGKFGFDMSLVRRAIVVFEANFVTKNPSNEHPNTLQDVVTTIECANNALEEYFKAIIDRIEKAKFL